MSKMSVTPQMLHLSISLKLFIFQFFDVSRKSKGFGSRINCCYSDQGTADCRETADGQGEVAFDEESMSESAEP